MNKKILMSTCRDCLEQFWAVDDPADLANLTVAMDRLRVNGLLGFSVRAFSPYTAAAPILPIPAKPGWDGRLLDVVPLNSAPAAGGEKIRFLLQPIDYAARRAVTAARNGGGPPPVFAFCDGRGRAVLVPDGLLSNGSYAQSDAACLEKWRLFLDPRWDREVERPPVRASVDQAVEAVNDSLQALLSPWELFWRVPFGWNLNVVPDTRMTLAGRMRELPGWPRPGRIDEPPRAPRERPWNDRPYDKRPYDERPYDDRAAGDATCWDLLGLYHADSVPNGKYPRSPSSHIVLFVQAIEEYCDAMALPQDDRWKVYFYVLVHELFHALQDFHVSLAYFHSRNGCALVDELPLPNGETFAENFALRAVRFMLGDRQLFRALCANWGRVPSNDPYAAAVGAFGGFQSSDSRLLFLGALSAWELKQRSR